MLDTVIAAVFKLFAQVVTIQTIPVFTTWLESAAADQR
jgi:hypothetical protein